MITARCKRYCCEELSKIENFDLAIADKVNTWDLHHRNEIDMGLTYKELKKLGLYYNRPASELIFLTKTDHMKMHGIQYGDKISDSVKSLWRDPNYRGAHSGKNHHFYGKKHSEESKKKMSITHKQNPPIFSEESKKRLGTIVKERWKDPEYREKHCGKNNPCYGRTGDKHPMYRNIDKAEVENMRKNLHLTYSEIAKRLGVSRSTLRRHITSSSI